MEAEMRIGWVLVMMVLVGSSTGIWKPVGGLGSSPNVLCRFDVDAQEFFLAVPGPKPESPPIGIFQLENTAKSPNTAKASPSGSVKASSIPTGVLESVLGAFAQGSNVQEPKRNDMFQNIQGWANANGKDKFVRKKTPGTYGKHILWIEYQGKTKFAIFEEKVFNAAEGFVVIFDDARNLWVMLTKSKALWARMQDSDNFAVEKWNTLASGTWIYSSS